VITDSDLIKHNVAETVRVWREGGLGRIVLPSAKPGTVFVGTIDQRGAAETIAWYLDCRFAEVQQKVFDGEQLSREEKRMLKTSPESVPRSYMWIASPDGRHWIRPLNALHRYMAVEWRELADHPTTYPVAWRVPVPRPQSEDSGFANTSISIIGDPLTVWTRLEHLDDAKWEERRRRGIPDAPPIDDELAFWRSLSARRRTRH
jgi:hypothetical protein